MCAYSMDLRVYLASRGQQKANGYYLAEGLANGRRSALTMFSGNIPLGSVAISFCEGVDTFKGHPWKGFSLAVHSAWLP